jgi:hypothetical protein
MPNAGFAVNLAFFQMQHATLRTADASSFAKGVLITR